MCYMGSNRPRAQETSFVSLYSCTLVSQAGRIKHLYRYRKYTKSQPLLSLQVESEHSQEVGYFIGWQLN